LLAKANEKGVHQLSMQHRVAIYIFDNTIYYRLHQPIAKRLNQSSFFVVILTNENAMRQVMFFLPSCSSGGRNQ